MKKWPLLSALLLLRVWPGFGQSPYRYVDKAKGDIYFGHVSRCDVDEAGDIPRVFRGGSSIAEPAEVNLPLTPGDTIRTGPGGRCELQFDSGSIVRLDQETELVIEAILAGSISSSRKLTNLVLRQGRIYVTYRQHSGAEVFQVLTANTAVKLKNKTAAMVSVGPDGSSEVQVERGGSEVLYGPEPEAAKGQRIEPGLRLTVSGDHRIELATGTPSPAPGFADWNRRLDERFEVLGQGRGFIPQPIFSYSPAVVRFAESYSRAYGEWVWSPVYGHAWRPHDNDYYPAGDWQPYRYGRWRDVAGERFWVPEEGWGWVPYHLGFWVWDRELGWIWLPGRFFAPAWVSWYGYSNYLAWRPWGFWDWYLLSSSGCRYGLTRYFGSCACPSTDARGGRAVPRPGGDPAPPAPGEEGDEGEAGPKPPPLEHRRILDRLVARLRRGDEEARASFEATARHLVVVRESEPRGEPAQERAREGSHFPGRPGGFPAARRETVEAVTPAPVPTLPELPVAVAAPEFSPRAAEPRLEGVPRFRDWNPDVRAAQRLGATVTYSSEANEVRCPELASAVRQGFGGDGWASHGDSSSGGGGATGSRGGSSGGSRGGGDRSSGREGGGSRERVK